MQDWVSILDYHLQDSINNFFLERDIDTFIANACLSFVGFTILRRPGHWYTAVFVGVILLIMICFVALLRLLDQEDMVDSQPKGPKIP